MDLLKVTQRLEQPKTAQAVLTLPIELRQKSRLRASLDNGQEVGIVLERGKVLRHGDCLLAENGTVIEVQAKPESVSTVTSDDNLLLTRVCYHLGNRHVPLQIADGWCRYVHDHVLDEMVESLGATIKYEQAPFEPEAGAYGAHSHAHTHTHNHD